MNKNNAIRLAVKTPMKITGEQRFDSILVIANEAIADYILTAIYDYQYKYRSKPSYITLQVHHYLSFWAYLRKQNGIEWDQPIEFQGVKIIPVTGSVGVNLENILQIAWEIEKCATK